MSFSGQYAAAQLEKLDHSPLFRGHTFPLAHELSAWLGYAPDFVPPTYLTFARAHQRIPSMNAGEDRAAYAQVLNRDAHNFEGRIMHANITRFDGRRPRLRIDYVIGTLAELREQRRVGEGEYYSYVVELLRTPEDARWRAAHGEDWPRVQNATNPHPVLHGASLVYYRYYEAWNRVRENERRSVIAHNNASHEI